MSTFISEDKHRQVLKTCIDVPEESPAVPLPLTRVGISGKTVWVRLAENNNGHIPFTVSIFVDLDAGRRGIHMSRIEQTITSLHGRVFASLPSYGRELAAGVLAAEKARNVSVELAGQLPCIRQAPISRLSSIDTIEVMCKATLQKSQAGESLSIGVGAGVHHLTACPCTLSYNEVLFGRYNDPWPQATHSQRSKTTLLVSPPAGQQLPGFNELLDLLADVLHISQDLLKRPDETELVLKAHRKPQFAEDTVREVAKATGEKFKEFLPSATEIQVHSLSLESIHIHNVECFLSTTLGEITETMQAAKKE